MRQDQINTLSILAHAISGQPIEHAITEDDWRDIYALAKAHMVLPLAYAGVKELRGSIPDKVLAEWRGVVVGSIIRNERLMIAQQLLVEHFKEARLPCIVLKGSSHSALYTSVETRPLGDIDILVDSHDFETARELLNSEGFFAPQTNHPFHVDFYKGDIVVELHFAVSSFPNTEGGRVAEREMNNWKEHIQSVKIGEYTFPTFTEPLLALNMLLHMERHMINSSIGLRQLCDWAFLISRSAIGIWETRILSLLDSCGLGHFARVLTKTCVRFLGIDGNIVSWCLEINDELVDAMMDEIFRAGNMVEFAKTDDSSSFFVGRGQKTRGVLNYFATLSRSAKKQFPVATKTPLVLPFFWVYLPVRYLWRSFIGTRTKKSILRTMTNAKKRNKLYRKLHLYEIK